MAAMAPGPKPSSASRAASAGGALRQTFVAQVIFLEDQGDPVGSSRGARLEKSVNRRIVSDNLIRIVPFDQQTLTRRGVHDGQRS